MRARQKNGSVLVIVLMTLVFAAFALVAFMEKASNDLLVEHRDAEGRRLRMEAYSALEVTLAVLEDFRLVGGGLRNQAEGWGNPLEFAAYTPSEDRTVEIAFEDESAKISLPRATAVTLTQLFEHFELERNDAETLADALMGWMRQEHIYATALHPDYDRAEIPYEPPRRSIRSWEELAAIEKVRELFFDSDGRPNDLWKRFTDSVSLFDFPTSNINGGRPDALAALGQFDESQQKVLKEYLTGAGAYELQGPGFFRSVTEAQYIAGPSGNVAQFGTSITALRVIVTVREGRSQFRLAAVVAPPNGATTIQTTATTQRAQASANSPNATPQPNQPNMQRANAARGIGGQNAPADGNAGNLRYPFTLLEIRENDEIPPAPPPPPSD